MKIVHLVDYGVGNIGSLMAMLESLGYIGVVTTDASTIKDSPLVLLPGVGSAYTAMRELKGSGLGDVLRERNADARPIMGICLGGQLLFSYLEEASGEGLGFLPGAVNRLSGTTRFNTGWCPLETRALEELGIARGLRPKDTFFFNHQYVFPIDALTSFVCVADTPAIPALYRRDHLCGIQFHPEKSQIPGRQIMKNLLQSLHGL